MPKEPSKGVFHRSLPEKLPTSEPEPEKRKVALPREVIRSLERTY